MFYFIFLKNLFTDFLNLFLIYICFYSVDSWVCKYLDYEMYLKKSNSESSLFSILILNSYNSSHKSNYSFSNIRKSSAFITSNTHLDDALKSNFDLDYEASARCILKQDPVGRVSNNRTCSFLSGIYTSTLPYFTKWNLHGLLPFLRIISPGRYTFYFIK